MLIRCALDITQIYPCKMLTRCAFDIAQIYLCKIAKTPNRINQLVSNC